MLSDMASCDVALLTVVHKLPSLFHPP